jgi:hypothetical protein
LHAEVIAHRTYDTLSFFKILGGGVERHEEAHHQAHQAGKAHIPAAVHGAALLLAKQASLRHSHGQWGRYRPRPLPLLPKAGAQSPMAQQILLPPSRHQESFAAVALAIVVDDLELVAVGDMANTLGPERLIGFDPSWDGHGHSWAACETLRGRQLKAHTVKQPGDP